MIIVLLLTFGSVQAENLTRNRLVALVSDPGSDLSGLKGDYNLQAAAALDARIYFQQHNNREYRKDCLGIGLEHAVKHHLKGRAVDVYALAFDAACCAFFAKFQECLIQTGCVQEEPVYRQISCFPGTCGRL